MEYLFPTLQFSNSPVLQFSNTPILQFPNIICYKKFKFVNLKLDMREHAGL